MAEADKKSVDWHRIEVDYRAGIKPLRLMAEEHGITHGAINKRAKKEGWSRDLSEKIRARAEEKVSKAAVSAEVSAQRLVTERQVVEANAQIQSDVILGHRKGLARLGALRDKLLAEVESITDNLELFEKLGECLDESGEDANGRWKADKQNEIYRKVISMSERIDSTKKLAEIDEKVRKGEREAFGLDKDTGGDSRFEELLGKIKLER